MRTSLYSWVATLACALALSACGDGAVRSPAGVGSGALLSIDLQCFTPDGGSCSNPPRVNVGGTVNFRVIGSFENGSTQDITASDRIEFSLDAPDGEAAFVTDKPGQVRGISPTDEGAPVLITASDSTGEASADSNTLTVVGGIPRISGLFADVNQSGSCDTPADGVLVAAGQALQLRAKVEFVDVNGESVNIPDQCLAQRDGLTWSATPNNPDGTSAVAPVSGVFSGQNTNPDEPRTYSVTAELVPPETVNPQSNRSTANANINVQAASLVEDSLEVSATPPRIIVGAATNVTATAEFDTGASAPIRLPVALEALTIVQGEAFISIDEVAPGTLSIPVQGIAATPDGTPAIVEGMFSGQTNTANIEVLAPEFASLQLVPVGVASFEDAGVFAGLAEEDANAFRTRIGEDAVLLGVNEDGQVPTCDPNGEQPCPNGALERHQTLPSIALPYAVVAYKQDDPEQTEGTLLGDFATTCDDDRVIRVQVAGTDDVIDVQTMRAVGSAGEGETPQMAPIETASGIRVALVEGLTEGSGTVVARLGGTPGTSGNGINCRSNETGETVTDASQDVRVGLLDDGGEPKAITKTTFNINKNFTCVGFTNASQLLDGEDIRGQDKLLSSLTFESEGTNGGTAQVIVNINQASATSFRTNDGPATNDGKACRNEETGDPSITITNAFLEERGVIIADGATGLAGNCAAADYNPTVTPPGFDDSPSTRAATVIVLPVDDAILQGESAISGEEVDGLCSELNTLFTLGAGELGGMDSAGLPNELVLVLEMVLGPILNNEMIEGPVSEGLEDALNTLSETVLGTLLGEDALGLLTDPLLGFLGLAGGESPTGFALLPTLVEGLGEVTDALNEAVAQGTGGSQAPEPTDPGDPFANDESADDESGGGGDDSPLPLP